MDNTQATLAESPTTRARTDSLEDIIEMRREVLERRALYRVMVAALVGLLGLMTVVAMSIHFLQNL